jgi:hypothetical protein
MSGDGRSSGLCRTAKPSAIWRRGGRFGVALTRANLDQVLAEIRASRARYEARRIGEIDLDNRTRLR